MPRQYKIFYRRLGSTKFAELEPNTSASLYDRPEVAAAIEHARLTPCVEGIAVRLGDELFNIIAFDRPAVAPKAFVFVGEVGGPTMPVFVATETVTTIIGGESVTKTFA